MSQSEKPEPPATAKHKQTPRVPSNALYDRIIPIALIVVALVLLIVLAVIVLGVGQSY